MSALSFLQVNVPGARDLIREKVTCILYYIIYTACNVSIGVNNIHEHMMKGHMQVSVKPRQHDIIT